MLDKKGSDMTWTGVCFQTNVVSSVLNYGVGEVAGEYSTEEKAIRPEMHEYLSSPTLPSLNCRILMVALDS